MVESPQLKKKEVKTAPKKKERVPFCKDEGKNQKKESC